MTSTTNVLILVKKANRQSIPEDKVYLCYEDDAPIPWEQDVIFVTDEHNRNWFVHESEIAFAKNELNELAQKLKKEHSPHTPEMAERRAKRPLSIRLVALQASNLDEMKSLLGQCNFSPK